jgi:hypothetical protein
MEVVVKLSDEEWAALETGATVLNIDLSKITLTNNLFTAERKVHLAEPLGTNLNATRGREGVWVRLYTKETR